MIQNEEELSIGLVGTYPPPFGGVSIHIKALKRFLEKRGVKCMVYNTGKIKNLSDSGIVNVYSLKELLGKLILSPVSLLHVHGGVDLYRRLIVFLIIKRLRRKRFIVTIHSGGIVKDLEYRSKIARQLIRFLFMESDHIICVSNKISESLFALGIPQTRCSIIPAFSIEEDLPTVTFSSELNDFITRHHPLMSSLGYNFEKYYGYELAIKALQKLRSAFPNIGLIIMGGDKEEESYTSLIESFDRESLQNVFFTGGLEHDCTLNVIKKSDVFLRPTYHDGDSISVREAIALGIPVVASDAEVRPKEVFLFKKGDENDLSMQISKILPKGVVAKYREKQITNEANLLDIHEIYRRLSEID